MSPPKAASRLRPTTLRRMVVILGLLGAGSAAGEPWSEAELVRQGLAAPLAVAELDAVEASIRADRTALPLLDAPTLDLRHEQAKGEWGATTNAVGATLTLDLGLSPLSYTRAAHLRGSAGEARGRARTLALACELRGDAVDLWAANRSAVAATTAQDRLQVLLATLAALAEGGDASGWDTDRAALEVLAHDVHVRRLEAAAVDLRAWLSARVSAPVADVQLGSIPAREELEGALARLEGHPLLTGLELELRAARVARDAARRDQLPDVTISGGPRWDASPTGGPASQGFEIGGSIQVPGMSGSWAESRAQAAGLADAEARLARARAEIEAAVRGAHARVEAHSRPLPVVPLADAMWTAAVGRYDGGEASLEDLLQVASAVEAAELAAIERERLLRRAHLDLACATGRFADPELQALVEEVGR